MGRSLLDADDISWKTRWLPKKWSRGGRGHLRLGHGLAKASDMISSRIWMSRRSSPLSNSSAERNHWTCKVDVEVHGEYTEKHAINLSTHSCSCCSLYYPSPALQGTHPQMAVQRLAAYLSEELVEGWTRSVHRQVAYLVEIVLYAFQRKRVHSVTQVISNTTAPMPAQQDTEDQS